MFIQALRKIYAFFLDILETLLLVGAVFLIVYVFLFRPFQVDGESMFPNFHNQEYVITNLITLRISEPKQGDVIVFKAPTEPDKDFIKRVIGLPGDTVSVQGGQVYVNSKLLDEHLFLKDSVKTAGGAFLKEGDTVTVPPDSYFVMGDNRPYSSDSREWGFVPKKNLVGVAFFVYWPVNMTGLVKNPY